jgi:gamma-glutamyl hercynylcysteine S-oxide synthase
VIHLTQNRVVTKDLVVRELEGARDRTLAVLDPVPDADQARQVSPLMSPLCWDLAHVAHYEELWLLRTLTGAAPRQVRFDDVYDAFRHPRRERPSLDLLDPDGARRFAADVRARTLAVLADIDLDDGEPLRRDAFVYGMVVQHEHQHIETMLATIGLMEGFAHPDDTLGRPAEASRPSCPEMLVEGGPFVMGTSDHPWAYDNERPAHEVALAPFLIDTTPGSNGAYVEFVESGGYDDRRWWSDDGWAWRAETGAGAPQSWYLDHGDGWRRRRFGRDEPVPPGEPVQHVCWYEADAYARFAGKRLPAESEWEKALAAGAIATARQVWPLPPEPPPPPAPGLGVDGQRLRRLPRLPGVPVPRVLGGLLRSRVQGAAGRLVGDAPQRHAHHVPQLGLPDPPPDLRRFPLRARRLNGRLQACVATSPTSVRPSCSTRCSSRPSTRCCVSRTHPASRTTA